MIGGYTRYKDKSLTTIKSLLCVAFVIMNNELTTADFSFSWLSLHKQWCCKNTLLQQPKKI